MQKILILLSITFCLFVIDINAQQKNNSTIVLLENDNISEVNINEENFIASLKTINEIFDKNFSSVNTTQKIGFYINVHTKGLPTFALYSTPKLDKEKEIAFLNKIKTVNIENTKLVDFPIFIALNTTTQKPADEFLDFENPKNKRLKDYKNANWKMQIALNKSFAVETVIPILSTYTSIVDKKYEGVKNFGNKIKSINFNQQQNITDLTSKNPDYWRATVEMSAGNQIIPITKVFLHISQGEFDYAFKDIQLIRFFSDEKSISNNYLEELNWRINEFRKNIEIEIKNGIQEHDKGNFEKAIKIYKDIIDLYPNSAWARYEMYYSQNALELKNNKDRKLEDRKLWDYSKASIFACNPLYNMDARASNGKEGYLLFRRQEISSLFKTKEDKLKDIFTYAKIAMDLDAYDFAAQLFWFYTTYSKDNENGLKHFLYCLEKLNVKNLKENFKYDFNKEFKIIEDSRESEMKNSPMYKAFQKN